MAAIPIPQQGDTDDPEELIRRMGASSHNAIPLPDMGTPPTAQPQLVKQSGQAIPTGRVGGIQGTIDPDTSLYNAPPAHQAGVASLWSKAENINNPVLRVLGKISAGLARGIDVAGSVVAPRVAAAIPGSTLNTELGENRQRKQAEEDTANQQKQAVTAGEEENTREAPKKLEIEDRKQTLAEQQADNKPDPTQDIQHQYAAAVQEAMEHGADPMHSPKVQQLADAITSLQKQPNPPAEGSPERQAFDSRVKAGADPMSAYRELHPEKPPAEPGSWQMGVDGQGNPILYNSKTAQVKPAPEGIRKALPKPSADEQRRADLAENLNENLTTLEDIVKRRPDLFGPLAGRMTAMRAAVGTSDPDIGTLETIKHQIGMAQISAHGMRSAHGIAGAADSILNNFHNSPAAVQASIDAAKHSVATFTQDVAEAKAEAQQSAGGGAPSVRRPLKAGIASRGGDPGKKENWEKAQ